MNTVADDNFLERFWLEMTGGLESSPSLRIGSGATVPVSYAQSKARDLFTDALYRLAPQISADLQTVEAWDLLKTSLLARREWWNFSLLWFEKSERDPKELFHVFESEAHRACTRAEEELDTYIRNWQARYRLEDAWVSRYAIPSIILSGVARDGGDAQPTPLLLRDSNTSAHDGKPLSRTSRRVLFSHEYIDIPISIFDLRYPELVENDSGWEWEDDGSLGTFDPRTETVDNAVKRMLPELERRLRHSLELHVDDDKTWNDAIPPVTYRSTKAFERLVRFQVLGESRNQIAKADGVERQNIGPQIKETARLIGLTLRDDKGDPE